MHSKTLTIIVFSSLFFLGFSISDFVETSSAAGTILYVDIDSPCPGDGTVGWPYCEIRYAVENASDADTIFVYSGIYYENVVINKDIILTGANKDTTIIDGNNNGHVIRAYGSVENEIECFISGFTIRNAGGTGNDCIAFSYVENGNIIDNKIMNSDQSSGIQLDHCNGVTISDNTISNNDQEHGIYLVLSQNIIINNNLIQSNSRGIYLYSSSNNVISNNEITGNRYGVYILSSSGNNKIYLNDFTNNDIQNVNDGGTNSWYYESQGNYWDDYQDYDSNKDGIGDTPYDIPGGDNQDQYPLGYFLNQDPQAFINSISPNPAIQGETVTFNGHVTDDGTIIEWEWRSNIDGVLSNSEDFTSSSLSVGIHTISFRVKDDDEQWSSDATETLVVNSQGSQDNEKPTATIISIQPNPATEGETITFIGQGADNDGDIIGYLWGEDDVTLSTSSSFNKSNLSVGTHTIYFKVRDNYGEWSDEVFANVTILETSASDNQIPVSNPNGPYLGTVNISILFNGSLSYDPDGTIVNYSWTFGDGTTDIGSVVEHTYSTPSNYTITLTVTDNNGSKVSNSTYVIISLDQQNGSQSGGGGTSSILEIDLPIQILAPIIAVVIFLTVLGSFFIWIRKS